MKNISFLDQHFFVNQNCFLTNIFFRTKISFRTKSFFWPKFFIGAKKNFGIKSFFGPNILGWNFVLVQQNFGSKKSEGEGGQNFEVRGQNAGLELFDLYKAYIPNLCLIPSLEPFKKFLVGGWWWVDTLSLVFCFGPKLWFRTWDLDQAEQYSHFVAPACKLQLARFSALLKFKMEPSVAKIINSQTLIWTKVVFSNEKLF